MNSARLRALGFAAAAAMMMVCAAICAAPADAAPGRAECRSAPSQILGHPVPYCVILPSEYDADKASNYPVLYFLHGLGGNEQLLLNSGGLNMIQDLRDSKRIGEFLIVAPDAGRSFYVNSRDGKVHYEDFFIREFLPYIESHYRVHAEMKSRGVTGVSMGGYGAMRFALRYPDLVGAVSAHSAALIKALPNMKVPHDQAAAVAELLAKAFSAPVDAPFWQ